MKDSLGIFGHPEDNTGELDVDELRKALAQNPKATNAPPPTRESGARERRALRIKDQQRRRKRLNSSLIALGVLLVIAATTLILVLTWSNDKQPPADFAGAGTTETVIRVSSGDGLREIGTSLLTSKAVASVEAFINAATNDENIKAIQPGYYKVRQGSSANSAIDELINGDNRVGLVDLIPGVTLADTTVVASGEVLPGYVEQITKAACVSLNGSSNCFTADQLWQVVKTANVTELGLVDWAIARVNKIADPSRRLEGMIVPGVYNVPPGNDPLTVLKSVISTSSVYWTISEIATKAQAQGHDPYGLAVVASLVERESIKSDMPNVARVIANRLALPMRLQLDSTVNYWKAESQIATGATDRTDETNPYNTYVHEGLPPTPIGGVGPDALDAALNPADGPWLYFVKIDKTGKSCFSTTLDEHNHCVDQARANGVFG